MNSAHSIDEIRHQFEQLAAHLPLAVALFDTDMQYLFVNQRWIKDYHLEQQEIIGRSHYDVFPEISHEWKMIHQHCLDGKVHRDEEVLFRRRDGSTEWISREIRPWTYQDGQIGGLIMYTEVITERKQARDELGKQHRFLRQVMDLNTSFVFAKDTDGYFTLVNQALADAYGSTVEEMVGKSDIDFNPNPAEVKNIRADDLGVLRTQKARFVPEEPVTHANGITRWYQTIKIPLVLDDGDEVQLLGIATDITERKQSQEQLERLVIQEQEARQAAEKASKMKDLFLANMSHELRTPLHAIIGFLREMLYSQQLNYDNTHMAERGLANGKRLEILINSVLDLSRLAVGSLELVVTEVNLRQLAEVIHDDLVIQAKEKGLSLRLNIDDTLPDSVHHDEERLTQIILNLMVNAIKYTQAGHVELSLQNQADRYLVIHVTDTGIGIPSHLQSKIFEDFVQLEDSHHNTGVGLGLSIVKSLVDLMSGTISLDSQVGEYSTFIVTIPLHLDNHPKS